MKTISESYQIAQSHYQIGMVIFSYVLAVLGSLVALSATERIDGPRGIRKGNVWAAGIALGGIGVWAMHFTGMMALQLDMGSGYSMVETVLSLVAAVVAASASLLYVAMRPQSMARIVGTGCLLGLGVAFMHYLGMFGMRFPGFIVWNLPLVVASVVIAMVAASAALWLSFRSRTLPLKLAAAALMGLAVCAMHYVGMKAADFVCTAPELQRYTEPQGWMVLSVLKLPLLTGLVALGMLLLLAYDQVMQRMFDQATTSQA